MLAGQGLAGCVMRQIPGLDVASRGTSWSTGLGITLRLLLRLILGLMLAVAERRLLLIVGAARIRWEAKRMRVSLLWGVLRCVGLIVIRLLSRRRRGIAIVLGRIAGARLRLVLRARIGVMLGGGVSGRSGGLLAVVLGLSVGGLLGGRTGRCIARMRLLELGLLILRLLLCVSLLWRHQP